MSKAPLDPEHRHSYELGVRQREMNTILGRIRRRRDGEPRSDERERLAELKEEITRLKRGEETL